MKYFPGSAKGTITTFRSKHFNNSYSYSMNCFVCKGLFRYIHLKPFCTFLWHFWQNSYFAFLCKQIYTLFHRAKDVVAKTKQMKKRCWPSFLNQTMEKVILEKLLDFPTILSQLLFLRRKTSKEEGRRWGLEDIENIEDIEDFGSISSCT